MYGHRATALAPFGVALALLVANAVVSLRHTARLVDVAAEVSRAQALRSAVTALEIALRDAEASQRGYLVTGDTHFRARYGAAVAEVRAAERQISEGITGVEPDAQSRRALVEETLAARLAMLDEGVRRYETTGHDAAVALLRSDVGARDTAALHHSVQALRELARAQDEAQRHELARAARAGAVSLGASSIAALVLLGVAAWAVARDAAARRRAGEALLASEARLRAIVDSAPVILFATSADGVFTLSEGLGLSGLGMRRREVVGRSAFDVYADSPDVLAALRRALSGDTFDIVVTVDDQVLDVRYTPTRDASGRVDGLFGVAIVITERVRAERQLRRLTAELERRVADRTAALEAANRELESFSYSVSHDLRAPLRSIDGFSAALEEDYAAQLDDTARGYLGRIRGAVRRMGQLIDDLLELSRVSRVELRREDVDVSAMARSIADDLARAHPERTVHVDVQDGVHANADPRLLRIVLENLLHNAFKFTARTQDARVTFEADEQDGHRVYAIGDNGAGFDMAYAHRLFAPFQRLHGPLDFEGTGVGLATVQRIVARHGGRVWATGAPGRGARVTFTLG